MHWQIINSDWQPIFYQSLPTHNYLVACVYNDFLIDFVSEMFIIQVTIKENCIK